MKDCFQKAFLLFFLLNTSFAAAFEIGEEVFYKSKAGIIVDKIGSGQYLVSFADNQDLEKVGESDLSSTKGSAPKKIRFAPSSLSSSSSSSSSSSTSSVGSLSSGSSSSSSSSSSSGGVEKMFPLEGLPYALLENSLFFLARKDLRQAGQINKRTRLAAIRPMKETLRTEGIVFDFGKTGNTVDAFNKIITLFVPSAKEAEDALGIGLTLRDVTSEIAIAIAGSLTHVTNLHVSCSESDAIILLSGLPNRLYALSLDITAGKPAREGFSKGLARFSNIRRLSLRAPRPFLLAFLGGLSTNDGLISLDLSNNSLTDEEAKEIGAILASRFPNLQVLNLSDNSSLTNVGLRDFFVALTPKPKVTTINVEDTLCSANKEGAEETLAAIFAKCPSLSNLMSNKPWFFFTHLSSAPVPHCEHP